MDRIAFAAVLVAVGAVPHRAQAQQVLTPSAAATITAEYLADLDTVRSKIVALANAIPESSYGWRPAAGTRTVSEALMHVASEWYFYVPVLVGAKPPTDFGPPRETLPKLEKVTAKAEVLSHLDKSWAHAKAQLTGVDPATLTGKYQVFGRETSLPQSALLMAGDLHEHLGQLVTYARSVGVNPPWSKKP